MQRSRLLRGLAEAHPRPLQTPKNPRPPPTGLTITPVSIGPGQPYEDPYGTWADLREIDDGGVLLVRPDLYIAARHLACPASPEEAREWLARVLSSILGPVPSHGAGEGTTAGRRAPPG